MPVFDVHVEVQVDEADTDAGEEKGGDARKELTLDETAPYSVTFERAAVRDGEDIELGKKEGRERGERGGGRS